MKKLAFWLVLAITFWASYFYFRNHSAQAKAQAANLSTDSQSSDGSPQLSDSNAKPSPDPQAYVQVKGPLAQWMDNINPWHEDPKPVQRKVDLKDRIAPSPVGTSSAIVRKTFTVTSAAKFVFEVPPHAASPQLHGSYRSFAQNSSGAADSQFSDSSADVDFLLLNGDEYAEFSKGNSPDVVYSVDSSHEQDVSFRLPATLDQPAQYYLVFRNPSASPGKKPEKKVIQADFRVDF